MSTGSVTQLLRRATTFADGRTPSLSKESVAAIQRRLANLCLIYGTAYSVAFLPGMLLVEVPQRRFVGGPETLALAAIALGFAVGLVLRRAAPRAARLYWLAPTVWVVGVVGIDLPGYWSFLQFDIWPWQISWACVWMVIFPLVVPGPPRFMNAGALLAALAGVGSFTAAAYLEGLPEGTEGLPMYADPTAYFIQVGVAYAVCAGIAAASAYLVYGLQKQAESARRLGAYELETKLGEGGMGEVWRARHSLLARPAAVKLIRRENLFADGRRDPTIALRRFEREARATAELRSHHTVQLYDFGETEDGSFYYAMEYLDGIDLEQLVERHGPQPAGRVVAILQQICESLAEAHGRGMIHRDIKPSNVLLSELGGHSDVVKIVDFGLVKPLQDAGREDDGRLTVDGTVPGTPAYMAPESMVGPDEPGPTSDLYSAGCVAYWLLTGRPVFIGKTPMEVALKHARDEPEPPSAVTELDVPPELDTLVLELLAKEPAERPADARELARRLQELPIEKWTEQDAERWWELHGDTVAVPVAG